MAAGEGRRQRILFLSHRIPFPPNKGEKIRAWHILRHLAGSHDVHLGCLIDDDRDWEHLPALRALCADVAAFKIDRRWAHLAALARCRPGAPLSLGYFHANGLDHWVTETLRRARFDAIFAFSSSMAPYVLRATGPGREDQASLRVLDMVNVDSAKFATYAETARWPMRQVYRREARTLRRFEQAAALAFDHTMLVSGDEREHFLSRVQSRSHLPTLARRVVAMENGVDTDFFNPRHSLPDPFLADPFLADPCPGAASGPMAGQGRRPRLVFTGTMDYRPNIDAVSWFSSAVMPRLAARRPRPEFVIVGANPTAEVLGLAGPDVAVTGRVADVRPYLAHADIVVAPLRIARGVQNKVLEAMAMARPVVASPQAFEGLRAEPGRELVVADGAAATALAIARLLDGAHPDLGPQARRRVEVDYRWDGRLAVLEWMFAATRRRAAAGRRATP